jgi:hypothetical protein
VLPRRRALLYNHLSRKEAAPVSQTKDDAEGSGALTARVSDRIETLGAGHMSSPSLSPSVGAATGTPSTAATSEKLGLEEIVHLANKVGLEFAKAKRDAERLDLLKPTVRARVSIRLDDGNVSEARLRRLTETDPEYVDFLEQLSHAKGECDKLRIRYESYKNLFEARRSLLSYQKAEMKLL